MPDITRIGFIGTGFIATQQAKGVAQLPYAKIVAACDGREDALKKFSDTYSVPHTFTDYNEMVQMEELDAISVCTPNYLHKDPVIAALACGKHVIVEKPMAMNAAEAQAMVDAAAKAEATLTMGFQTRLAASAQTVRRFIEQGHLGKVLWARCQAMRRRGIPSWGVFGQKELQGGGPLIDIGVHTIECAYYLLGEPRPVAASAQMFTYVGDKKPDVVTAMGDWDHKTYNVEDLAIGLIRFDNGAVMSVEASFVANIKEDVRQVQIMAEKGGAVLYPTMIFKNECGVMTNVEPLLFDQKEDSLQIKMTEWIRYVRGERGPVCAPSSGLNVQKILDGLYASAEAGKEVQIG